MQIHAHKKVQYNKPPKVQMLSEIPTNCKLCYLEILDWLLSLKLFCFLEPFLEKWVRKYKRLSFSDSSIQYQTNIRHPLLGTSSILVSLGWISCSDATNFIYFIKFSDFSRELLYQSWMCSRNGQRFKLKC